MNQKHLLGVGIFLSACLLSACDDKTGDFGDGYGAFSPSIGLNTEVVNGSSSRAVPVSAADLSLKLTNSDGTLEVNWAKVSDFDTSKKYPVGEYTLEAYFGKEDEEGYEMPHYYGSTKFNILEDKETQVSLTAQLGNGMISPSYSEAFTDYMVDGSWSASVRSAGGATTDIPGDETRPVYVKAGPAVMSVTFTKANGQTGTFQAAAVDVKPRTHYIVNFDVDAGSETLVVTFNDNMETREVTIDISEKVFAAPEPEIVAQGFDNGQTVEYIEHTVPEIELAMAVTAIAGIKSVHLNSVSNYLTTVDFPNDLDLVAATNEEKDLLTSAGLVVKGLWKNMEDMALVDFSNLADLLPAGMTHTFTLTVTDVLDRVTEPMTLVIEPTELILELEQASERLLEADTKVYLRYNGLTPTKSVVFEMQNERGTFDAITPLEFVEAPEKGEGYFLVTLPTAASELSTVVVRATSRTSHSNDLELTLKPLFFNIDTKPVDVYSTTAKAFISLLPGVTETLPDVKDCTFLISRVGVSAYSKYTYEGDILFSGLRPNTSYEIWVQYQGMRSEPAMFTTETQPGLDNADLDDKAVPVESGKYWTRWELPGWANVNGLTTSQKNGTDGTTYTYVCNSGTSQTTDAHSGSAALIRTVGWGSGNTAAFLSGFGTCKHVTAGELFLGKWNGVDIANTYGVDFAGRPTTISFWYKYKTAKTGNGDYGTAEIVFKDANGKVIFSETKQLPASDTYKQITITPTYTGKAATLSIAFKSTGREDALQANATWMTAPPARNLSTGEYVGSSLYIDDIELIY